MPGTPWIPRTVQRSPGSRDEHPITFTSDGRVEIAGEDVSGDIRDGEIDRLVPAVARHPEVREVMRERQRTLGSVGDIVIEGRDIGSVVAPAGRGQGLPRRRRGRARSSALRRIGRGRAPSRWRADLRRRDERDAVNTQPAEDAVLLDTTELTVDQVVLRIAELVEARR